MSKDVEFIYLALLNLNGLVKELIDWEDGSYTVYISVPVLTIDGVKTYLPHPNSPRLVPNKE